HGRVRRADQRRVHVLRAGLEEVADDLGGDEVGGRRAAHRSSPRVIASVSARPAVTRQPGGTTVVAVGSPTIAGPPTARPPVPSRRCSTAVSTGAPSNVTGRAVVGAGPSVAALATIAAS